MRVDTSHSTDHMQHAHSWGLGRIFVIALSYLLAIHVFSLFIFSLFRLYFFLSEDYVFPEAIVHNYGLQSIAFLKGLWFDNVVACYILVLPLVAMSVAAICNKAPKALYRGVAIYFTLLYALAFGVTAANIPYFAYFFKIINSSIYEWFGYVGTTIGMLTGESSYYGPIASGVLAMVAMGIVAWKGSTVALHCVHKARCQGTDSMTWLQRLSTTLVAAGCIGACVFGIRGRMGYNPIKVSQAYYCEDLFLNQLGVNPMFNLLTSTLDDNRKENRRLQLMDPARAVCQTQQYLHRQGMEGISPLARKVPALTDSVTPSLQGHNVVMVIMESMSAHLMNRFGNEAQLTPVIDSLYSHSLAFSQCYSAGIHTNHGLYASLYSFPAIMKRNAMKGSVIPVYSGLPTVLREKGYRNLFFMTHESQYDNMNAFFRTNGFDEVYAQEDYPKEKVVNSFGVQDDFLYSYAIAKLHERAAEHQPFFAVMLSISNHPPFVVPDYFHPRSEALPQQIVEYADWAVGQLMAAASKEPWFDNTIFVFVGDHGKLVGTPECEVPQSYNHVPLFFYGKDIAPRELANWASQTDIQPTLLAMLGGDYVQNNFGIDLLHEHRDAVVYSADNQLVARDSTHLFIYEPASKESYCYRVQPQGVVPDSLATADYAPLKDYCFSLLQAAEELVHEGKTLNHPNTSCNHE